MTTLTAIKRVHKRSPEIEESFLAIQNELNHQRWRADTAERERARLEAELNDAKRRFHVERGFRQIAYRDRDAIIGDYAPTETAAGWKCGNCNGSILRHFTYCPTCSGHINWKAVAYS